MMGDYMLLHASWPNMIGNITLNNTYPPEMLGGMFIMAGQGIKNISTKELVFYKEELSNKQEELNHTKRMYEQYKNYVVDYVKTLPSHYQYLKDNIYGGKDDFAN